MFSKFLYYSIMSAEDSGQADEGVLSQMEASGSHQPTESHSEREAEVG